MLKFYLDRKTAGLVVLQRIELISPFMKKIRKLFGRHIFTNFIIKYFLDIENIKKKYYLLMKGELNLLKKFINFDNKKVLSIGSGIGGLEVLIGQEFNSNFSLIEKNYISKKVKYGWDLNNEEAYNDLNLVKFFFNKNGIGNEKFKIFDFDTDSLPSEKFDIIISLYSLDYHYDFKIYSEYLKKVSHKETVIVFDTIRADSYFEIFKKVLIIKEEANTTHRSKRILCREFK